MKHRVSELEGALLDAAVALADDDYRNMWAFNEPDGSYRSFAPSTDWSIGGPIIEREGINPFSYKHEGERYWAANMEGAYPFGGHGCKSALIAAMRAYVASKLGEEVELP